MSITSAGGEETGGFGVGDADRGGEEAGAVAGQQAGAEEAGVGERLAGAHGGGEDAAGQVGAGAERARGDDLGWEVCHFDVRGAEVAAGKVAGGHEDLDARVGAECDQCAGHRRGGEQGGDQAAVPGEQAVEGGHGRWLSSGRSSEVATLRGGSAQGR